MALASPAGDSNGDSSMPSALVPSVAPVEPVVRRRGGTPGAAPRASGSSLASVSEHRPRDSHVDMVDAHGHGPTRPLTPATIALRMALVCSTAAVAFLAGENFSYVGSIVGAVGATSLSLILPCIFHLRLYHGELSLTDRILDHAIPVIGFVGGVCSLVTTIQNWFL